MSSVESTGGEASLELPHRDSASISREKCTEYLLNANHPVGRGKAAFFLKHGFTIDDWEWLARALRLHAQQHRVSEVEQSQFGTRYIIEGVLPTPDGRFPRVRSVWFIEIGTELPRLVTAYPLPREIP